MRFITASEIEIALDQKSLIEALRRAFRMGASARPYQAPLRNRFYIENVHAAVRAENSLDTGKPLLDLEGPNELLNDTPHASEDDDESSVFIDFVRYGHLEREAIALLLIASFALGLLSTVYTAREV